VDFGSPFPLGHEFGAQAFEKYSVQDIGVF